MLKLNKYIKTEYELEEGIRQWIGSAKRSISGAFRSAMKRVKNLKAGESMSISVSMPKDISEAKEKQMGKKGGELAEVAMMRELYKKLKKSRVEVVYWEQGKQISAQYFNKNIFDKNLEDYRKQEGKNKRKREKDWIRHGEAGAEHVFTYLEQLEGSWDLYRIKLEHLGEALTGISKGDVNVIVEVKKTEEILDYIGHLSVKTTLENSPLATPSNALQTSWDSFVLQLLVGKTSRQMNFKTENQVERAVKSAANALERAKNGLTKNENILDNAGPNAVKRRDKARAAIEKFQEDMKDAEEALQVANEMYKETLSYQLDELGKEIGYNKKTPLSKYMGEMNDIFKKYNKAAGRKGGVNVQAKDPEIILAHDEVVPEYMTIIKKAIEVTLKSPAKKKTMIEGILKLGGIESGLDYLALGVDINDKQVSAAISTLGSKGFVEMQKRLAGELTASVKFKEGKRGLVFTIISSRTKLEILSFDIGKSSNNARIYLPTFPGDDGGRLKLLDRYAEYYDS